MSTNITLQNNALVTLAEYNDFHEITTDSDNPSLTKDIINKASDLIEKHCMRKLKAQKIRHEVHRRTSSVELLQFPLISIEEVVNGFEILTASGTASGGSTTTLIDSVLSQVTDFWAGAQLQVEISAGVWERMEVDSFASGTGTLTVLSKDAFSEAPASGDAYRLTLRDTAAFTILDDQDFNDIDYDDGTINFKGAWSQIVVTYFAGYSIVPVDLQRAAILQIKAMLGQRTTAGATVIAVAGASKQPDKRNAFTHIVPEALDLLALYRRKVI